ncbi:MAG: ChrR family anti-sigma-E factor [Rhodovibrionaceae bacterium]|nr:ChrR family anti-sigma-E factor [Rhodovibrionaceae bacterium]
MTEHHPDHETLLDYAAGHSREPVALLVATHLALCPQCRREVAAMEEVGGVVLEENEPSNVDEHSLDAVLARIERGDRPESTQAPAAGEQGGERGGEPSGEPEASAIPRPLRDYIGGSLDRVHWKRLSGKVAEARLLDRHSGFETRLMRIGAGGRIPVHTHEGREFTLVLKGGFTDEFGHYVRGDVAKADSDMTHQPVADADGECICLAVTDAPLRFTGPMGKLINIINRF